jgi:hypothetical protein
MQWSTKPSQIEAEGIRSLLSQLAQMGMATDDLMPIDTLESRLRTATVAAHSQVEGAFPDLRLGHALTGRPKHCLSCPESLPPSTKHQWTPMGEYQQE